MATAISNNFNASAAGEVYRKAGTLDLKGADWKYMFSTPTQEDVDMDATIKGSSLETNLAALEAGYKGTNAEASVTSFKKAILSHEDLKKSAEAMIKDEGGNVLEGMQKLLTGNSAVDMGDFEKMMNNPVKRKAVVDMFDAVGTNKYGMDHAVEFTRLAMDAANNPLEIGKGQKFLSYAESMHIDTKDIKKNGMQAGMMDMFNMFIHEPDKIAKQLFDALKDSIPPEYRTMVMGGLSQLIGGLSTFLDPNGDWVGHYVKIGKSAGLAIGNEWEKRGSEILNPTTKQAAIDAGTGEAVDPKSKAAMDSSKADFTKSAKGTSFEADPNLRAEIDKFDREQVATRTQPVANPGMAP